MKALLSIYITLFLVHPAFLKAADDATLWSTGDLQAFADSVALSHHCELIPIVEIADIGQKPIASIYYRNRLYISINSASFTDRCEAYWQHQIVFTILKTRFHPHKEQLSNTQLMALDVMTAECLSSNGVDIGSYLEELISDWGRKERKRRLDHLKAALQIEIVDLAAYEKVSDFPVMLGKEGQWQFINFRIRSTGADCIQLSASIDAYSADMWAQFSIHVDLPREDVQRYSTQKFTLQHMEDQSFHWLMCDDALKELPKKFKKHTTIIVQWDYNKNR